MPKKTTRTGAETALSADIEHLETQKQTKQPVTQPTSAKRGRPVKATSRRSGVKAGTHEHLNVIVNAELHQKIAVEAVTTKKSMSEIVEAILNKHYKL